MYTVPNVKLQKAFKVIVYHVENLKKKQMLGTMVVNNNGVIMKFIFASMIQQNFYSNKKTNNHLPLNRAELTIPPPKARASPNFPIVSNSLAMTAIC